MRKVLLTVALPGDFTDHPVFLRGRKLRVHWLHFLVSKISALESGVEVVRSAERPSEEGQI